MVGEALIDIVVHPSGEAVEHVGGSPANVAVGLARLGHRTRLATYVGTDERGRRIAGALAAEGVALEPGSTDAPRTPTATARLDAAGAATYDVDLAWRLSPDAAVPGGGHLHTGSLAATLEPGGAQVLALVERARPVATISYDPNARPTVMGAPADARARVEALIALSDVVKASDEDVAWLYDDADPRGVLARWRAAGPPLAVLTRGGAGALVAVGDDVHEVAARVVEVADTVGAGDSFSSGLISGLLDAGLLGGASARDRLGSATWDDVRPAVERALACSAITVTRAGADPPRRIDLGG